MHDSLRVRAPWQVRQASARNLARQGKTHHYLGLAPIVVVVVAAFIDLQLHDPMLGDTGRIGALVAFAGIIVVWFRRIRSSVSLFLLVFATSFLSYEQLLKSRIKVAGFPVNVVDVAICLTLIGMVIRLRRYPWRDKRELSRTGILIVIVTALFVPAFVVGVFSNSPYDAFRDLRPFIMIGLAFIFARKATALPAVSNLLVHTMILGGLFGMALTLQARLQRLPTESDYIALRSIAATTPTADFAYIMVTAFIVCGGTLLRKKWMMYILWAFTVSAVIFTFSLTAYGLLVAVPIVCILLAPVGTGRKVITLGLAAVGAVIAVLTFAVFSSRFAALLWSVASQVIANLGNTGASIHVTGRLMTWATTFDLLGTNILTGVGLGKRVWLDTGIPLLGTIVAGEPTYATYLLGAGIIGVIALIFLQARLLSIARRQMRVSSSRSTTATMLGFAVFAVVTILNGFLHNNFMAPQLPVLYGVMLAIASQMNRHAKSSGQHGWHGSTLISSQERAARMSHAQE